MTGDTIESTRTKAKATANALFIVPYPLRCTIAVLSRTSTLGAASPQRAIIPLHVGYPSPCGGRSRSNAEGPSSLPRHFHDTSRVPQARRSLVESIDAGVVSSTHDDDIGALTRGGRRWDTTGSLGYPWVIEVGVVPRKLSPEPCSSGEVCPGYGVRES